MHTKSIWNEYSDSTTFPELKEDIKVDTVIIGGGISGISIGHQLSLLGHQCAILEKEKIGGGTSSHSTGNLYVTVDRMLSKLHSKYNLELVKKVVAARREAMDQIIENVEKYHIPCDVERRNWYLYSNNSSDDDIVQKEYELAMEVGLNVKVAEADEIPYQFSRGIKVEDQIQFNPMKYVQGLAHSINTSCCHIFENSPVTLIEKAEGIFKLHTKNGIVKAKNLVHATHTPKGFMFLQSMLGPYREYGIACKLKKDISQRGIFWGYHDKEKFSTRLYEVDGIKYLIIVGKPHKVGQSKSNKATVLELEDFAHKHFSVEEVVYKWGGQHYRPADMLPYIGKYESNLYVATGYSTDGLTYGCLAGKIIKDQIAGKENQWSELFNPSRHQPIKAAKEFTKENMNVAKQYLDLLPDFTDDEFSDIPKGEGRLIHKNGHKLAAYRRKDDSLLLKSAICPHLGCVVNWNNAENSWDCPCHGSRFKIDGSVLEGPAMNPLEDVDEKKLK